MKLDLPGLLRERLPSGNHRYRVRVAGSPRRRIRLHVTPDHPDFLEHYHAARQGVAQPRPASSPGRSIPGSMAWLMTRHLGYLEDQVQNSQYSPLTLKKRKSFYRKLTNICGNYSLDMPRREVMRIRDRFAATPAAADDMIEAIRTMYRWAIERDICTENPAIGIPGIYRNHGGARPWTVDDLDKYRAAHAPGTTAHLCMTILLFTACRIGDALILGRRHETVRDGVRALGWQPRKKGSAYVMVPMLPPLYRATRAVKIVGETYILSSRGRPFSTPDSLGQMFRRWCAAAGIDGLSAHGIRKAAGHLLARAGCSQYQIMAIHGHTQAGTSEIYTRGVERWSLARDAMRTLEALDW